MIVLIDAGNTRVKLGWLRHNQTREPAITALLHTDLYRIPQWLAQLPDPATAFIGVNVAGTGVAHAITAQLTAHGYTNPVAWMTAQTAAPGIRSAYERACELGADRWVSLIGLVCHVRGRTPSLIHAAGIEDHPPLMLANFGTATTVDTLAPSARLEQGDGSPIIEWLFPGGMILPGPSLMRSSLVAGTANLPQACGRTDAYPTDTHRAIATGIAAAQAGALVRQWLIGSERYGRAPTVYSAGGGWRLVEEETQRLLAVMQKHMGLPETPIQWLASPVLDGLACLARESGTAARNPS